MTMMSLRRRKKRNTLVKRGRIMKDGGEGLTDEKEEEEDSDEKGEDNAKGKDPDNCTDEKEEEEGSDEKGEDNAKEKDPDIIALMRPCPVSHSPLLKISQPPLPATLQESN